MILHLLPSEPKEPVVFIERVLKKERYLLIDFPVVRDNIDYFQQFLNLVFTDQPKVKGTMLELTNVSFEKNGTPREGSYYRLPKDLLTSDQWVLNQNKDDYPYIGFTSDNEIKTAFKSALGQNNYVFEGESNSNESLETFFDKLNKEDSSSIKGEFIVRSVGQGNFNEFHLTKKCSIFYDCGSRKQSIIKQRLKSIAKCYSRFIKINRIKGKRNPKSVLIISHWDIDHYNGLLDLEDYFLDQIDLFIVPKRIYGQTSAKAYERIKERNTICIPMRMRIGDRSASTLQRIFQNTTFSLYRGSNSSNRNKSGLVLTAYSANKDFIMPGDHHYDQLDKYVFSSCVAKEKYLVVPHHGGKAGPVSRINSWPGLEQAVFSCGKNPWHHPLKRIQNEFKSRLPITSLHYTTDMRNKPLEEGKPSKDFRITF